MKKGIFYTIVAITSYSAGILAYLSYLSVVYNEGVGSEWLKFLVWTLPRYSNSLIWTAEERLAYLSGDEQYRGNR